MVFCFVWVSCVDKVDLSLPTTVLPIIIDGHITDQPGPYFVRVSKAYPVDGEYHPGLGVEQASVNITSSTGESHPLTHIAAGYYVTDSASFLGHVGRTYQLHILLPDNTLIESTLEQMASPGSIDSIYAEFVTTTNQDTGLDEIGYNIYVDATLAPGSSRRMRWKYNGIYEVTTDPSQIVVTIPCPNPPCPTGPLPCATNCECCYCWVHVNEEAPIIPSTAFNGTNEMKRVFMRYVPINNYTFNKKYWVQLTQMELSQPVYDFYSGVRGQIENGTSLFQPPFFELKGNVSAVNAQTKVVGVFSAAATTKRDVYFHRADVPRDMANPSIPADCRAIAPKSSTLRPPFWE
jgi:hypothetical protein